MPARQAKPAARERVARGGRRHQARTSLRSQVPLSTSLQPAPQPGGPATPQAPIVVPPTQQMR